MTQNIGKREETDSMAIQHKVVANTLNFWLEVRTKYTEKGTHRVTRYNTLLTEA